jgi:hypothetical protein
MKNKIPTAEEFLDLHSSNYDYFNEELNFIKYKMIEFAKLHVKAAAVVEDDVEKLACKEFCFPIDLFYEMKKCSQNDYLLTEEFGLQNTVVYFQCLAYIKAATKIYNVDNIK